MGKVEYGRVKRREISEKMLSVADSAGAKIVAKICCTVTANTREIAAGKEITTLRLKYTDDARLQTAEDR